LGSIQVRVRKLLKVGGVFDFESKYSTDYRLVLVLSSGQAEPAVLRCESEIANVSKADNSKEQ